MSLGVKGLIKFIFFLEIVFNTKTKIFLVNME